MLLIILEIFIIFVLPVILWHLKLIPFKMRFWGMLCGSLILLLIAVLRKLSLYQLGFRYDNLTTSFFTYFVITILGIAIVLVINRLINNGKFSFGKKFTHFPGDFLVISILQEFVYRSFLMNELSRLTNSTIIIILIDAVLFALPHTLYQKAYIITTASFAAGIAFAGLFSYYPNFILLVISHAILNYMAFSTGLLNSKTNI